MYTAGSGEKEMAKVVDYVERFSLSQRILHILLFSALIILSITGLALKYHESMIAQWIIKVEGGVLFRGMIHRVAAVILMVTFAYHFLSVLFTRRGHDFFHSLLFGKKDFIDSVALIKYMLGLQKEMPLFGRFTCIE
jgi:formate dehydrogenase subunit gamma